MNEESEAAGDARAIGKKNRSDLQWMRGAKYFDVPFGLVETIKDEKLVTVTGATELRVTITCKDLRCLVFILRSEQDSRLLLDSVESFGTPGNPAMLFAFKHMEALRKEGLQEEHDSGWDLYDPEQDRKRTMGNRGHSYSSHN
eukprot:s4401_g1.t4